MAGSRLEKLSTIFSRVNGLLRSKAMKEENRPLWFDIYKAFPPIVEPRYDRKAVHKAIPDLLYPEDIIRARFYKLYGNPDVVDLTNEQVKTTCQKFIENYFKLQDQEDVAEEDLFQKAIDNLKAQGIRLRTITEKESEEVAEAEMSSSENRSTDSTLKTEQTTNNISNVNTMDHYGVDDNLGSSNKT
ncbi:28S ribosomal protein S23, mitochondrial [Octopus sinensis]|uniref:Small ribosomal subunit protein mS23 n=1 Tax=Octopus sinensis TaxID=2607531 RepID=A0A6P7T1N4_9MOLL|nr:28S ribosomal protein S23, mitochondrial [Octopus sinensis]XP_036359355.1 28S ribosomal protein S23, mitochondrial [Octopus sinensis]